MASEDSDSVIILSDESEDSVIDLPKRSKKCLNKNVDVITLSEESDESITTWNDDIHFIKRKLRKEDNRNEAILSEDDEITKTKGAIFINMCSTCNAPSKYRCPKCSRLSCSLACVKTHKAKHFCDGERDPKAFVPVEEFKESNLRSDFHFLEDINRVIDNAERARFSHGMMHKLPHNLFKLQQAARNRKTNLLILPLLFSRRKLSTTYFRYSDGRIFWRVEWSFPLCNYTCSDDRIDEDELLVKCLDKYMWGDCEELMYYRSLGHKGVTILMKDLNCRSNETKYHVLRKNKTLRLNFEGKKIVEFPTLLVVPNIHLSAYVEE